MAGLRRRDGECGANAITLAAHSTLPLFPA
jgi:hypothetical protein